MNGVHVSFMGMLNLRQASSFHLTFLGRWEIQGFKEGKNLRPK